MIAKDFSDLDSFRRKTGLDLLCPDCAWNHVRVK